MITQFSNHIFRDTDREVFVVTVPKDKLSAVLMGSCPYEEAADMLVCYVPLTLDGVQFIYRLGETDIVKTMPAYSKHPFLIEGRYSPMEHQRKTAAFMTLFPRCYVLSDCRLGKTGSAIMAIDCLQAYKAVSGAALIITTLTTVNSVWVPSIQSSCPTKKVISLHGKKDIGT